MAMSELMMMHHAGQLAFVERNYAVAESILRAAAERGHPHSQCWLGLLYELGRGVLRTSNWPSNGITKRQPRITPTHKLQSAAAMIGASASPKTMVKPSSGFKKAAEAGFADGQYELGQMYEIGTGVPLDYEKSFYWYSKAAAQGLALAQNRLGAAYAEGKGVTLDDRRAFEWFSKAAEQGHADSQGILGTMYATGHGVLKTTR
jgi:uncharacterized protein